MRTVKLPGFSADASLYWGGRNYREGAVLHSLVQTASGTIRPAVRNSCECYKSMGGPVCVCNISHSGFDITVICDKFGCY